MLARASATENTVKIHVENAIARTSAKFDQGRMQIAGGSQVRDTLQVEAAFDLA
jgi:hypothetical protein